MLPPHRVIRAAVLALAGIAFGQSSPSLTGDWVSAFAKFDAKGYERVNLAQSGDRLTGESDGMKLTGSIKNGKIELEGKGDKDHKLKASGVFEGGEFRGTAVLDGDDLTWRMYPEKKSPGVKTHTFEPTAFHRQFTNAIPPVLHVFPGDSISTWTVDAGGNDAQMKKRSNGGNPETGPFYVEGALPGDVLAIKLNRVRLNRDLAFSGTRVVPTALHPGYFAGLQRDSEKVKGFNGKWILDREKMTGRLEKPGDRLKEYTVPLRPMMGCIGVAPPAGMAWRTGYLGVFGGNMDYNEVREGVTVYLPVFEPGALLFIGDGHAAQGDGELTGDALETSMDVTFTVDVIRGKGQSGPRMESADYLMASGIAGSLHEALQMATTELSRWLARDYDLNYAEIGLLFGSAMRYDIAEVVDPFVHVVAKIPKKALASIPPAKGK
ncbi:MAG: acetamidase/formamidase family protein [Bryobacteraceae bacterium]